ncbi:MAG: ACT domain-containing protein [Acidobacteria bacterium]|nr:ACT domain-containing protein [Acidobacteriota bacterium]
MTTTATTTGLIVEFHNIPGALMRVLNCFTRRGLVIQAVQSGPTGDRHRASVVVEAQPITIEQTVRELESTVGVDSVSPMDPAHAAELLQNIQS